MTESYTGRLLIASPHLADGNFDRTIVFMLQHEEDEGAVGVVLNRPTESVLDGPIEPWARLAAPPAVFFQGGPVGLSSAVGLGRVRAGASPASPSEGADNGLDPWTEIAPGIVALDLDSDVDEVAATVAEIRVFAGYAGWEEGQLEGEMAVGAWFVVDAHADDVFHPDPEQLWRAVLKRQRNDLVLLANYPPDPSLN